MIDPQEFYAAWRFLNDHAMVQGADGHFDKCLDIHVARVNPATEEIDDDLALNTRVEIWLEFGPWVDEGSDAEGRYSYHGPSHDYLLDVGAETFEGAIIKLATLVRCFYEADGTRNAAGEAEWLHLHDDDDETEGA